GVRSRRSPRASSTSALPQRLETARLPCLATTAPAAAATSAAAVEMLKVLLPSPPVPTMSTNGPRRGRICTAWARMARAQPVISATVSPFMRRATRNPATWAGVAAPRITASMAAAACSSDRSWPSTSRRKMSRKDMAFPPRQLEEIGQHGLAVGGKDGFRVKLHPLHRPAAVAQGHDLPVLLLRHRAHLQLRRHRSRVHHQRMVTDRRQRRRQPGKHAPPVVPDAGDLAVHQLPGPHQPGAEGDDDALVTQAYAQNGYPTGPPPHRLHRHPRLLGGPGPGRDDDG